MAKKITEHITCKQARALKALNVVRVKPPRTTEPFLAVVITRVCVDGYEFSALTGRATGWDIHVLRLYPKRGTTSRPFWVHHTKVLSKEGKMSYI